MYASLEDWDSAASPSSGDIVIIEENHNESISTNITFADKVLSFIYTKETACDESITENSSTVNISTTNDYIESATYFSMGWYGGFLMQ